MIHDIEISRFTALLEQRVAQMVSFGSDFTEILDDEDVTLYSEILDYGEDEIKALHRETLEYYMNRPSTRPIDEYDDYRETQYAEPVNSAFTESDDYWYR